MPNLNWSKLTGLQLGRYAEYYAKMEFASYGFEVYTSEVDDHGVDFIAKKPEIALATKPKISGKTGTANELPVRSKSSKTRLPKIAGILIKKLNSALWFRLTPCTNAQVIVLPLRLMPGSIAIP